MSETYHLIGIGGAGMSGLARVLKAHGNLVTGSDRSASAVLDHLRVELGEDIFVGHDGAHIGNPDVVVVSAAIADDNPELVEARRRGIRVISRAKLLGEIMDRFPVRIAVTGTHGKTTTSAMAAQMLAFAGKDPTALIGSDVIAWSSNVRVGASDVVVAEACEAFGSFLEIRPTHTIITNIESDHLDYYKEFNAIVDAFQAFVRQTATRVIVCVEGGLAGPEAKGAGADRLVAAAAGSKLLTCGIDLGEITATILGPGRFSVSRAGWLFGTVSLKVPGRHNILNALSVVALGISMEIPFDTIAAGLAEFQGTSRRFETVLDSPGDLTIIDDYAHHPTEIRATLAAAKSKFESRRIVALFQPHLPSRTRDMMGEFAAAFGDADVALITDIYLAREDPIPGITAETLAAEAHAIKGMEHVRYSGSLADSEAALRAELRSGDVVLTLGAGDVRIVADRLAAGPPKFQRPVAVRTAISRSGRAKKLAVAIVTGGRSSERDISLVTADRVRENLDPARYVVNVVDSADYEALIALSRRKPDVAFIAQHGKGGEDGSIQGVLETIGIPYTGSGILASALALDKLRCKEILAGAGIPLAKHVALYSSEKRGFQGEIELPIVVKPNSAGSSDGVTIVRQEGDIAAAIDVAFRFDSTILIEEYIPGMEITGGILGNENLESLPLVEIIPVNEFYDRQSKYTAGMTEEICPARLPATVTQQALQIARDCHKIIGCRGMSRTDMMVTAGGDIRVIEINTIPGMTAVSLLPFAALKAGYTFPQLLDHLIELALEDASS